MQSKFIKACANKLCPLLLMQRVVMNWRFGFCVTSVCGSNNTPMQWSADAMLGMVCGTLYQFSMLVYILSRVAWPRVGTWTICFNGYSCESIDHQV